MKVFRGKSVFGGIAIGKISIYKREQRKIRIIIVEDSDKEVQRYETARSEAIIELEILHDKALKEVGEVNAAIFEIHQMMLEDDDYNESIENIIDSQKVNAEYAVAVTADNFAEMFASMDDPYM